MQGLKCDVHRVPFCRWTARRDEQNTGRNLVLQQQRERGDVLTSDGGNVLTERCRAWGCTPAHPVA
jgi:hypothetical protein